MTNARQRPRPTKGGELVDFDEALLQGCPADELSELRAEADLLTTAFADGARRSLDEMAWTLTRSAPPRGRGGLRARRLAAVLRLRGRGG